MLFDEWNEAIFLRKNLNNFHLNQVTENVSIFENVSKMKWFSVKRIPSTEEKEIPGSPQMATHHETKHMIKYVEIPYTSWTGRRQFSFKNQRSGLRSVIYKNSDLRVCSGPRGPRTRSYVSPRLSSLAHLLDGYFGHVCLFLLHFWFVGFHSHALTRLCKLIRLGLMSHMDSLYWK